MSRAKLTHCARGHERTPENLQGTTCRLCKADWQRARRAGRSEAEKEAERAARRNRRRTDEVWAERERKRAREQKRAQYHSDEAYRTRQLEQKRSDYQENVTYREHVLAEMRRRYRTDPAFRAQALARSERLRQAIKADPERLAPDRDLRRLRADARRRARGSAPQTLKRRPPPLHRPDTERLDGEPMARWLAAWAAANPDDSLSQLAKRAGFDEKVLRVCVQNGIQLDFVDRVLVQAGEDPTTLHALYPLEFLHDDGTGYFEGGWDGQPAAQFTLVLPEPAPPHPIRPADKGHGWGEWWPPAGTWPLEHEARIRRIRHELRGEGWEKRGVSLAKVA